MDDLENSRETLAQSVVETLRQVEWIENEMGDIVCPWCGAEGKVEYIEDERVTWGIHNSDCLRESLMKDIEKAFPDLAEYRLSPCPFDKGMAGVQHSGMGKWRGVCSSCGAEGPEGESKAEAADRWNRSSRSILGE